MFEHSSGLHINMEKCGVVGINKPDSIVNNLAETIRCVTLAWPIAYLGIPLDSNPRCKSFWNAVVCKVSRRLQYWKGSLFSLGGRISLIQACLSSILIYYMSLFKVPTGVIKHLDGAKRKILRAGNSKERRDHLVKREVFCRSKAFVAWGMGNLKSMNLSLLVKWLRLFSKKRNSLWYKVIKSVHGSKWNSWDAVATRSIQHKSLWKLISSLLNIYFICLTSILFF